MKKLFVHFYGSFLFCAAAAAAGFFLAGPAGAATVLFLSVLETSLSFDNAVVNAGVLRNWDETWRRRFLVWGMPVAVFGMRLLFPLVIVGIAGKIGPFAALDLALNSPAQYQRILASAHPLIAAFGGTFLTMVFLEFFVDRNKDEHWLHRIEELLTRLGKMEAIEAALALALLLIFSSMVDESERLGFIVAGIWGIIVYILVRGLSSLVEGGESGLVRQSAAGFLYLELLDASFSFDGVVGAFAMTDNLLIITLGLGAGAMFVRSFTLLLVERGTLDTYRYLEHGAFWAIGLLAGIMLASAKFDIPEAFTGLAGAVLIGLSLYSSIRSNRK